MSQVPQASPAKVSQIFVGWDSREDDAYQVCYGSLMRRSTKPIQVRPLIQTELRDQGLYTRKWHRDEKGAMVDDIDGRPFSTEFSFSRFLVPALMDYRGWAMFVDLDFLFLEDIQKLFSLVDDRYAVMCVHHHHVPKEIIKMDGVPQSSYQRKNWSSMVLWNCEHPANRVLTAEEVNSRTGGWLHRFSWLSDELIGSVPEEWNWLEGHSPLSLKPKAIHYTRGGPWFENYRDVYYAQEWLDEFSRVRSVAEHESKQILAAARVNSQGMQ